MPGRPDSLPPSDAALPAGGTTPDYFPHVYAELRTLAERHMRQERPGLTLQPTALVNEVFLRLSTTPNARWENERHFFAAAGEAMRRILIERARRVARLKHGGGRRRVDLDAVDIGVEGPDAGALLALDDALAELRELDPLLAEVVTLRYFAGLTVERTAELLGRSPRSIKSDWATARAWLLRRIQGTDTPT
jgi:RNA polymerase sigma factor (TIGR02999 family)